MINKSLNIFFIYPIIFIIKLYQIILSPILKNNCKYLPTCSEYTITALKEYGLFIGLYYSFKRIMSCNPLGGHGFDPVPKKTKGK